MTVTFVTAIYTIHPTRSAEIWERFNLLCKVLPVHIVCSESDADRIPENAIPIFRELEELETTMALQSYDGLPRLRSAEKDTKEFNIVMNAKTECLQIVKEQVQSDHYIWIDAGISKIFKDPTAIFEKIKAQISCPLKSDTILIPGCWPYKETNVEKLTDRIHWRFCGGFFVVPYALVDSFATEVLNGCVMIGNATGKTTWETNIWCFVEDRLPIQWERGDHNETIIDCLCNYLCFTS